MRKLKKYQIKSIKKFNYVLFRLLAEEFKYIYQTYSNKANNTEIWWEINGQRLEDGCFRTTSTRVDMVKRSPKSSCGGSIFSRGNWARACAAKWNSEDYYGLESEGMTIYIDVGISQLTLLFSLAAFEYTNAWADGHVLANRRRGSEWIRVHFFCIDIL